MKNLKRLATRLEPPTKWVAPKDQIKTWTVYKGDRVQVISGKDKGHTGSVVQVLRDVNSVVVSGANMVFKHVPMSKAAPSGKVQKEMPIHVTNVQLIDPSTGKPTKVFTRREENPETKKLETRRYSRATQTLIPRKERFDSRYDQKEGSYDTQPENVAEVTFKPSLLEPVIPEGVLKEL
ncbi:hypothetical protein H4R35_003210, partial [Dimargaris xerosporica]